MVKRASALVLAFLLVLVLVPGTALAATTDVATGAEFASAASLASSGDIINLTADVDCTANNAILKSGVKVNCNSHVLTVSGMLFNNSGTITGQVVVSGDYFRNSGTITGQVVVSGKLFINDSTITGQVVVSGDGFNNDSTITGDVTVQPTASSCASGGTINGNLIVPSGGGAGYCSMSGTVTGNVNVASGRVSIIAGTIQSDLSITGGVLLWRADGMTGAQPTVNGNISVSNAELKLNTNGSYHSILTVKNGNTLTIGAGSTITIDGGNYFQTEHGGSVVNNSANPIPIKRADGSDYIVAAGTTFSDTLPISITANGTFPVGQAPAVMDVTVASGMAIYFTSANHTDYFTGATLDGMSLSDPANFTGEDGSIILHLNQSYLNTLTPGTHLLRVNTLSGYFAEANIVVTVLGDEADVPTTGDTATPLLWVGLSVVAIAGLVVLATQRKRAL